MKIPRGTKVIKINLSRNVVKCPKCGNISKRHSVGTRTLKEAGIYKPTMIEVTYSKHYCPNCRKHFSLPMDHLAMPCGRFTNRVRKTAVDLVSKRSMTLESACRKMKQKYHVYVPITTLHGWVVSDLTPY